MAVVELTDLSAKGVPLSLDDVVWLHRLCSEVESPSCGSTLAAGVPAVVGNVTLWPWTLQGQAWYEHCARLMPASHYDVYIVAYALAHGRIDGAFDSLWGNQAVIKSELDRWRGDINVTLHELSEAVVRVAPIDEDAPEDPLKEPAGDGETDYAETIAQLVAQTGIEPDVWQRKVCTEFVLAQMAAVFKIKSAEGGSDQLPPQEIEANRRLGLAILEIKKRQAEDGQ